jgi:hypothetical protein
MNTVYSNINAVGAISNGVPLPPKRALRRDPHNVTSLLRRLAVGDSILLAIKDREGVHSRAQSIGIRVATRLVDATTVRVWRVA